MGISSFQSTNKKTTLTRGNSEPSFVRFEIRMTAFINLKEKKCRKQEIFVFH